jgi:glutathione synthase/RimK-type ligase-like ATP-grasp enzyme
MPSTVLIITNELDEHADAVVLELHRRNVPVFRLHPEDFPHACSISIEVQDGRIEGEIINKYHRVAFKDICAAWYRRAQNLLAGSASLTSTKLDNYVKAQSTVTLTTLYQALQTLWVGHPHKLRRADIKALQLAEASKAGLKTPHTLISNDPAEVAAFVDLLGEAECAIKPLIAFGVSDEQGYRLPLTTTLPKGQTLDAVALAPTIFQPYIPKAADVRCVVIGKKIFSAKINSQANESTRMDWRGGDCQHEIFALPEQVEAGIHRLMDSFGINFASLDMVLTPEGECVFLELNPNGQWLWLEEELGFPLLASMADLLTTNYSGEERRDVYKPDSCQREAYA